MFILTSIRTSAQQGAYAVENQDGEKHCIFFEEEDDAERYAMQLKQIVSRSVVEIEEKDLQFCVLDV